VSSQDQQIMFVFPGQGSQYVGMGSDLIRDFPVAQRLYQQANDILGYDLLKLCLEGPEDDLRLTRHTQPALLVHSLACLEIFRELTDNQVQPVLTAGHSLGEYCALVAAGTLSFETALRIGAETGRVHGYLRRRGNVGLPVAPRQYPPDGGETLTASSPPATCSTRPWSAVLPTIWTG
jgi:[acyl-carrier-protein] S-malonyltransferase